MKILLWLYSIVGTLYLLLYLMGSEIVMTYAVGPLWLMMWGCPFLLAVMLTIRLTKNAR